MAENVYFELQQIMNDYLVTLKMKLVSEEEFKHLICCFLLLCYYQISPTKLNKHPACYLGLLTAVDQLYGNSLETCIQHLQDLLQSFLED